jgi:hypothetical protein
MYPRLVCGRIATIPLNAPCTPASLATGRDCPLPRPHRFPTVYTRPEGTAVLARAHPGSLTGHPDRMPHRAEAAYLS